jgi:hypothetical protein
LAHTAGTTHKITKAGLKKATRVIREQRRRQKRPQAQAEAEDEAVLDV